MGRSKWALLIVLLGMMVAMGGCFGGGVRQTGWVEGQICIRKADADLDEIEIDPIHRKLVIVDDPVDTPPPGTYWLEGAKVKVEGISRVDTTDRNGYFRLDNIPVGTNRLIISHPEFKDYTTESFTVFANQPSRVQEQIYGVGYYVIIGVQNWDPTFRDSFDSFTKRYDLQGPHNDITYIQDWLALDDYNSLKTFLGVLMYDPDADDVLAEVANLAGRLRDRDYLVIYFSGHSVRDPYYGDGLVCYDRILTDGELCDALTGARSTDITLILDGCFTGSFADGNATWPKAFLRTPYSVLAAADEDSFAFEVKTEGYGSIGLFTKHLVESLRTRKADRNSDGKVTVSEIYAAIEKDIFTATQSDTGEPQRIFKKIGWHDPIIFKYWPQ